MPAESLRYADRPANLDLGLLAARIALVLLFLIAGYYKLIAPDNTARYFGGLGLPMPGILVWLVILAEIGLPLLLLVGFKARWVALALLLFTLATAFIGHKFWTFDPATQYPQYFAQLSNFFKNVGIAAGFGLLALVGPGRYSVDERR